MNPLIKRGLAISAIAPLAFIASVGSAAAASSNWDEGNAVRTGKLVSITDCVHPLDADLRMEVYVLTEGTGAASGADDIEEVTVFVSDEDRENESGPDTVLINEPNVDADRVTIRYYSDNFPITEPSDLRGLPVKARESERVRQGRAKFDRNVDDVQWVRVTAEWDQVGLAEDDSEELNCYFELNP